MCEKYADFIIDGNDKNEKQILRDIENENDATAVDLKQLPLTANTNYNIHMLDKLLIFCLSFWNSAEFGHSTGHYGGQPRISRHFHKGQV